METIHNVKPNLVGEARVLYEKPMAPALKIEKLEELEKRAVGEMLKVADKANWSEMQAHTRKVEVIQSYIKLVKAYA